MMKGKFVFMIMMAGWALAVQTGWAASKTYQIDPAHSSVTFKIRHLVGKVRGSFDKFQGTIEYDEKDTVKSGVRVTIEAASISTATAKRDDHLRSADFFDVEKYPVLTFTGNKISDVTDSGFTVQGDLTMHGITKSVALKVDKGEAAQVMGGHRVGFSATAKLNRKEFGLHWNKVMEAGMLLVGEDVEIQIEVEAGPPKEAKPNK